MSAGKRLLYASSNGDRWSLCHENGSVFVEHVPNAASGGATRDIKLAEFLSVEPGSPQCQALMALIATLAHGATEARN